MTEDLFVEEVITSKIYFIREKKVMLDKDLANLYGVETKRLKEAVRRNIERFPKDFMFEMSIVEFQNWRSQFVTSNSDKMSYRISPYCFTEQGVTMLSCILNSTRAINVNIQIIRIFTKLREVILTNKDILLQIEKMERVLLGHDQQLIQIFKYLKELLNPVYPPRNKIGFKPNVNK